MTFHFSASSFIAGFMVGALLVNFWASGEKLPLPLPLLQDAPPISRAEEEPQKESSVIAVADQSAGTEVSIESVTVPPPGVWVAVRERNGRDLGNVLGAARVNGPRTNVAVALLRATEPGLTYAVQLYRDDGSGTFDVGSDSVYVDFATGASAVAYFTTTD